MRRNRLLNLNTAHCGCYYTAGEPDMFRSGIYLGKGAERPAPARGNLIEDNEITGLSNGQPLRRHRPGHLPRLEHRASQRCRDKDATSALSGSRLLSRSGDRGRSGSRRGCCPPDVGRHAVVFHVLAGGGEDAGAGGADGRTIEEGEGAGADHLSRWSGRRRVCPAPGRGSRRGTSRRRWRSARFAAPPWGRRRLGRGASLRANRGRASTW